MFLIGMVLAGVDLKAVLPPLNLGLMQKSRSRFKQSKTSLLITRIYVLRCFVNFWVSFLGMFERR